MPGLNYDEGVYPVPAGACTRCGGRLEPAPGDGEAVGFFTPSPLYETTWLFTATQAPPEGADAEGLACGACGRRFRLYRAPA